MPNLHILKVFVGEDEGGKPVGGNPLGVFLDGFEVASEHRQSVARDLGFSETVFVDDLDSGELRIFTPEKELPFAGHPLVGTAWLMLGEGFHLEELRPPAGIVPVRQSGEMTYIKGRPEWAPHFEHLQLGSPEEVEGLSGAPEGYGDRDIGVWAWEDESEGRVRVRVFVPELGVPEDEATGAHAVRLAAKLGRPLIIRQGVGSIIVAEPQDDGMVEIGGKVELVEEREYDIPARG